MNDSRLWLYCDSKVTVFMGICCVQGGVYGVQHMAEWLSWGLPLSERSLLPAADRPPASRRLLRGGNQGPTAEDHRGAERENTAVWLTLRSGYLALWQRQSFTVCLCFCDRQRRLLCHLQHHKLVSLTVKPPVATCHKNMDFVPHIFILVAGLYHYIKFLSFEMRGKNDVNNELFLSMQFLDLINLIWIIIWMSNYTFILRVQMLMENLEILEFLNC